jgi:hypothetical protein
MIVIGRGDIGKRDIGKSGLNYWFIGILLVVY